MLLLAAGVRNAVLDRAKGLNNLLGGNAQPVGDVAVQLFARDGFVGVTLPAAAKNDGAARRQLEWRHAALLHPLQRKVQKRRKTGNARRHAVFGVIGQRRQHAKRVKLVLPRPGGAQRPKHLGRRRIAHQKLVGVGGANLLAIKRLIAVDHIVGRRGADHAARRHHVVHHAPRAAQGEVVKKHLRLLPGGARRGQVGRNLALGNRQHLVRLEKVGVDRRQRNHVLQRAQIRWINAAGGQKGAIPR